MAELLLELYSEEIPPQLQIAARSQIKQFIENSFEEDSINYKELLVYSSPTRLMVFINNLAEKIKIEAKEIKGPKVGSLDQVLQGFIKAKNVNEKDLIEKDTDKGKFYFRKNPANAPYAPALTVNGPSVSGNSNFPNVFTKFLNFWFKCEVFTDFFFNMLEIFLRLEISIKVYFIGTIVK